MCRIVGLIDFTSNAVEIDKDILISMRDAMQRGGPDASGLYINKNIGLGHRRLSIIDLSEQGNQPLIWDNWIIVFNGEIYNYKDIRNELEQIGYIFSTKTDTEVIVKAYDCWGQKCLNKLYGMFSFALYNKNNRNLILCRDRLGVKPLYWYFKNDIFLFSSEIKAFHHYPNFDKTLDLTTIPYFLQKGYFSSDKCVFQNVNKLQPGTILEIDSNKNIIINKYWDVEKLFKTSKLDIREEKILLTETEKRLNESFELRMVSDVNVGIFLSGGVDSSLVATLLQNSSSNKIDTFTLGFHEKKYNESDIAEKIALEIGTNHNTFYCKEQDFVDVIPLLPEIYDEPFGDTSSIPTYLISKYSSKKVKVVLSGDGGDELFGGYAKYKYAVQSNFLYSAPSSLKNILYNLSYLIKPSYLDFFEKSFKFNSYSQISNKYHKFQNTLLSNDIYDYIDTSSSFVNNKIIKKFTNKNHNFNIHKINTEKNRIVTVLGVQDMLSYLPNDILVKVDRATMYNGQEAREPFLDHDLLQFSLSIPDKFKISPKGETKYLLKKILSKYINPKIIDRPKQGFTVPIDYWIRNNLKNQIIDIKNDNQFFETFGLNKSLYIEIINSFYNNKQEYNEHFIWFIFCLHNWYLRWIK